MNSPTQSAKPVVALTAPAKLTVTLKDAAAIAALEALAAKQNLTPTPCAAQLLTETLLKPKPKVTKRQLVVLAIAVLIVCGEAVGLPRGIAALRGLSENESKQSAALLEIAEAIMAFQEAESPRWTPGTKAQQDTLSQLIPSAMNTLLWVTTDPEDPRILPRIIAAKKANPRLKISIVTNDGSSAQAGILRLAHGLVCAVTTSPIGGNISWLVIDDKILVEATAMFATGTTRNTAAITWINEWAALITAQPPDRKN